MLRVRTKVGQSKVHGLGLFAEEFIPKGTITWAYDAGYDLSYTQEDIDHVSPPAKEFLLYYCYFDTGIKKYVLCADNLRYINHAKNPDDENIISTPRQDIAARDIQPGEEMMCDYYKFDPEYFGRIGLKPTDLE